MNIPSHILISVVVPAFNVEKYIERCVDSLLQQTHKEMEIIVIDDLSTDGTAAILDALAERDARVRVIHMEKNVGVHAARVVGVRAAKGGYIGFVDSDDWVAPRAYAKLWQAVIENDADIAICGADKISEKGAFLGSKVKFSKHQVRRECLFEDFCQRKFGSGVLWNKLYRAALIRKYGTISLERKVDAAEDYIVNVGCFSEAQCVVTLPKSYYYYLVRSDSASRVGCNGKNFSRILAAYVCCLENYSQLNQAQLAWIEELFTSQMRNVDYRVESLDLLEPHKADLKESLQRLAEVRPEAIYSLLYAFSQVRKDEPQRLHNLLRYFYITGRAWLQRLTATA